MRDVPTERIAVTRRHEFVLPTPVTAADLARAISAVHSALPDERDGYDDAFMVEVTDDAIMFWWPESTVYEAS